MGFKKQNKKNPRTISVNVYSWFEAADFTMVMLNVVSTWPLHANTLRAKFSLYLTIELM